jgi:3-oxo-5alpha-steroid 4-dehydrogenase
VQQTAVQQTAVQPAAVPQAWDIQADVVVVGFGAAGACAALEAAAATLVASAGGPSRPLISGGEPGRRHRGYE